jgi:hypothetical protein
MKTTNETGVEMGSSGAGSAVRYYAGDVPRASLATMLIAGAIGIGAVAFLWMSLAHK